ncbi:lactonase family protein [Arenibacter sp. 6A1]|uniref:lactonase family protein n=1 Tax=Arenibacter sp. 6A1 TaxID=2720391 RepID=UPI001444FD7E|nr:lactonase family protein [Arenibacter sp. 6A1]NKI26426.1 lactonase family protein [Arenibacter sp. 6A1]
MKLFVVPCSIVLLLFSVSSCKQTSKENQPAIDSSSVLDIKSDKKMELLVGTYTQEESQGIYRLKYNPVNGELSDPNLVVETENPSYLHISKDRNTVFAVNENNKGTVSSFSWNADRTNLSLIGQQSSEGQHPCYITLNEAENLLAAANYSSGNIVMYKVSENGRIEGDAQIKTHEGTGSVMPNQASARAHCVQFGADGKYLYAVDLGIDQVLVYPIDAQGKLGASQLALALEKGDGPRHLTFHPTKNLVFIINELSSSVVTAQLNPENGTMVVVDKKSTLPTAYKGKNAPADIHLSSNGKFLYASNRGHNSIAVFSVSEDGSLQLLDNTSVEGDWPRNFVLSPDEKFLLVANQISNNITVFSVDAKSGLLSFTGNQIALSKPVSLNF